MTGGTDTGLTAEFIACSPDPILVLDEAGVVVLASRSACRLLGGELSGRHLCDLLDPFSQEKGRALLERSWVEATVADWELDHRTAGGGLVLLSYTTFVLPGRRLLATIGRDQTEKLELTARLAATNQELEGALLALERAHVELQRTQTQLVQSEKMRSLGQLVAGVAHEINNPAAFVGNNLAQLAHLAPALEALYRAYEPLKSLAGSEQQAAIAAAEAEAEVEYLWQDLPGLVRDSQEGMRRIREIVLSLRNFARLDEAEYKLADVNDGLRSTLQIIRPLCQDRIRITAQYGELPPILCRPGELNQVFLNLLTNAVQAIPDTGQIWVTSEPAGDRISISVRDTGQGMDEATLARLGEPFFTTKPVGSGTGLGLAVSFSIVERHGGRLCFESRPGAGALARLDLPIRPAQVKGSSGGGVNG